MAYLSSDADDELAEVLAGEEADQRFGGAVDAVELMDPGFDVARSQPARELARRWRDARR